MIINRDRWMSLFFLFVWYYMYKLTKTCFILIARFSLRKKDIFFSVIRSFFIIFLQIIFSDFIPPFFNIECVHIFVTTDCVYWDDRTSYLEQYRDVIHVYFKFLCNETGCKVINMIYRYWFITNHDWWSVTSGSEGCVPQHCLSIYFWCQSSKSSIKQDRW